MKILFTADWHIKLGQKNVPIPWARDRYYKLFEQLHAAEANVDIHIIGGDIFDKLPSMEELEIFFDFVSKVSITTYIYSGNHEALKKNTTFLTSLKKVVSRINPLVFIIDDYFTLGNSILDIIPYNKLKEYHPGDIDFHAPILCTHVRGEIPPHVKPEVPLELFERWQVVLAGDLHSYDNCQRNILYPGSPVTTSFHRSEVDTGYIILDTDTLEHEWIKLDVPQLIRKTVKAGEEMPATEYHHTIYEVEGDMSELSSVSDNGLIDKKIVKRSTDTALILDPNLSMAEEVTEYARYILMLEEPTIDKVLKEYSNHEAKHSI